MGWLLKGGVDDSKLRPELTRLQDILCGCFEAFNARCVVTCTNGDHHGMPSYHNLDAAIDVRVKHLGSENVQRSLWLCVKRQIDLAWPGLYDVLLEVPGTDNAHLHIECGPKLALAMFGTDHITG